ncbi:hypothetical protein [Serratia sp. Se-RSBMAAmG]|nr:hypothetical protein [Serratia sp. Se-RSBMAAmG]MDI6976193.1 hypothetical protein [Serratia sp. Se-RSBMAAmG]
MFFVMCTYEGKYQLATSKPFASKEAADQYASGVDASYKAFVVSSVDL